MQPNWNVTSTSQFQTWSERVARQVSDLEKDRTYNEERTHDEDGKPVGLWGVRPLYTPLLRCFLAENAKAAVELEVFAVERVRAAEREAEKKATPWPLDQEGKPICHNFNSVDGRCVDQDGKPTCTDKLCSKSHTDGGPEWHRWPFEHCYPLWTRGGHKAWLPKLKKVSHRRNAHTQLPA